MEAAANQTFIFFSDSPSDGERECGKCVAFGLVVASSQINFNLENKERRKREKKQEKNKEEENVL